MTKGCEDTIGHLCYQVGNEECCSSICEIVAFQLQVLWQTHDCGILVQRSTKFDRRAAEFNYIDEDFIDELHRIA